MKALTLWRPWPVAIFYLKPVYRKDIENRSWKPPKSIIGKRIAIHAGAKLCNDVFDFWLDIIKPNPSQTLALLHDWPALSKIRGIVGTVMVSGWHHSWESTSRWASPASICWELRDPIALPKPIPCKGAQGLWEVPPDIAGEIKQQIL